jgi:hypothetical protein
VSRAYHSGEKFICPECGAPLAHVRHGENASSWVALDAGWIYGEGVWTITRRARERLRQGRRPSYRRRSRDAPGASPWHSVRLPTRIKCWLCDLEQVLDLPGGLSRLAHGYPNGILRDN